ncbi:MAG: lamin tail domain-containing protein [Deltaproteobacteria bacterium]|nr:MAG: lamin tail domain-containing protein [Deltaproteobacteria bacterium]
MNAIRTPRAATSIAARLWFLAMLSGSALPPGLAHALPVISEVFYDAVGSDNGQSFVELYGESGTALDGLVLEGVNGSNGALGPIVVLSGFIPCDGVLVVADDLGDGTTLVPHADLIANFDFQNGPDSLVLRDAGRVLDAVGYGDFGPEDIFAGEGFPAPDAPSGSSLARVFADLDSDDNFADFRVLEAPTPGSAPRTVPEPSTAVLLLSALAGLGAMSVSRRR